MKSKQPSLYEMMQEELDNTQSDENDDGLPYPLPKILNARERYLASCDEHYIEH